jgi:EAL domain-containing protein (putative c-di-GMP-specific phosphodiesterase class I)
LCLSVSAIVRLARALRLDVIAEGVETEVQRVCLAAAGCDDIQGYLFGKPMPAHAIRRLLDETLVPAPAAEQKTLSMAIS